MRHTIYLLAYTIFIITTVIANKQTLKIEIGEVETYIHSLVHFSFIQTIVHDSIDQFVIKQKSNKQNQNDKIFFILIFFVLLFYEKLNRNFTRNVPGLIEKKKPFERNKGSTTKQQITSPIMPASPIGSQSNDAHYLMRQNQELRDRLQEEASLYRRRLDTYRQAQQNQAALVSRLQTKVLQYKQKCNELENRVHDSPGMPIDFRVRNFYFFFSLGKLIFGFHYILVIWWSTIVFISCTANEFTMSFTFH